MRYAVIDSGTDRQNWLTARQGGVTATDVARLARGGTGTWAAIRAEKQGRGRDFRNVAMQHGVEREPFIAAYAQSAFGVRPSAALLAAVDEPRFLATPDALSDQEVDEFKTTVHDWHSLSDAPGRYIDQNLWQQRVTGIHRGRLVFEPHESGIPLYPFPRDFVIEYDQERVEKLEQVALEFLESSTEPDEDAAELDALLAVYIDLAETASAAQLRVEQQRAEIEAFLGGKPRRFEGSVANLTRSEDSVSHRFDSTGFKKADPDTYQRFVKATPVKGRLVITARSEAA